MGTEQLQYFMPAADPSSAVTVLPRSIAGPPEGGQARAAT